nr:translation initiation factor IF-2-like [Equus asinus]
MAFSAHCNFLFPLIFPLRVSPLSETLLTSVRSEAASTRSSSGLSRVLTMTLPQVADPVPPPPGPAFSSSPAPAKFPRRSSKGGWKPSSSLSRPSQLRSNQSPIRTHAPTPGPPRASIPVPQSLFPPQTSRRPAPRPPGLARAAAAPSPSPPLPTCWEAGSRQDRRAGQGLAARAPQLCPRGPAVPTPRRPWLHRPAARPPSGGMRSAAPACARHSHAPRAPNPAAAAAAAAAGPSQSRPGLRPAPGRWAAARAPRRPRPLPGRLPSCPPHPDPPAAPFLTGGRAGFAGRREPTPISGLPRARARGLRRRVSPRAPGVSGTNGEGSQSQK